MTAATFDPLELLSALSREGVRFVLIGGVAARIHGSPSLTRDVDICHARDDRNLAALARVLNRLEARLRGVENDVPFLLDKRTLKAGGSFTFTTAAGDLDILAIPAGVEGYDELLQNAELIDLGSLSIHVAALEDLMRMKRAAGRAKDRAELEILGALQAERDRRMPG